VETFGTAPKQNLTESSFSDRPRYGKKKAFLCSFHNNRRKLL